MKDLVGKDVSFISKEEIAKLTREGKERIFRASPRTLLVKLRELHAKVNCLVEFLHIIGDIDIKQFKVSYNTDQKEAGNNPAFFLIEYIIQEISTFYTLIHLEKDASFPEAPYYHEDLKKYRNAIPGHADKEKRFRTAHDMLEVINPLDKIGLPTILLDFDKYFRNCLKVLEKKDKDFKALNSVDVKTAEAWLKDADKVMIESEEDGKINPNTLVSITPVYLEGRSGSASGQKFMPLKEAEKIKKEQIVKGKKLMDYYQAIIDKKKLNRNYN